MLLKGCSELLLSVAGSIYECVLKRCIYKYSFNYIPFLRICIFISSCFWYHRDPTGLLTVTFLEFLFLTLKTCENLESSNK